MRTTVTSRVLGREDRPDLTPEITPVLKPSHYKGQHGKWAADVILVTPSGHRHGVGYVDPTGKCRRDMGGEILPGPYAYAYGLAVAITADPRMSTAHESKQGRDNGYEYDVQDGDHIRLGWERFKVRIVRRQYIELDHVGSVD